MQGTFAELDHKQERRALKQPRRSSYKGHARCGDAPVVAQPVLDIRQMTL